MERGDRRRRLAHAAADFKNRVRVAAEDLGVVERLARIGELVAGKRLVERALLRGGNVPAAHDEAADVALLEGFEFFGRKFGLVHVGGFERVEKSAGF